MHRRSARLGKGGGGGGAPSWVYQKFIRPRKEAMHDAGWAAHGPTGVYTHFARDAVETHSRSKACYTSFCGACYEKAKGRNYR